MNLQARKRRNSAHLGLEGLGFRVGGRARASVYLGVRV